MTEEDNKRLNTFARILVERTEEDMKKCDDVVINPNMIFNQPSGPLANELFNSVTGPAHYLEGRQYEPRKVIEDWELDFYLGNTVKYISRAGRKNDTLEDLKKARQYLDWEIEKVEKEKGVE